LPAAQASAESARRAIGDNRVGSAHRAIRGNGCDRAFDICDKLIPDFEHALQVDRAGSGDGFAQRMFRLYGREMRGLTVIPLRPISVSVWADNAIARGDLVPLLGFSTARATNPIQIHGQSIGVE
jgi:hypothetical protein